MTTTRYFTRAMSNAVFDREPLIRAAMRKLSEMPVPKVENWLREVHEVAPIVARGLVQTAATRLLKDGGAMYHEDRAPRIPGSHVRYHNPSKDDAED